MKCSSSAQPGCVLVHLKCLLSLPCPREVPWPSGRSFAVTLSCQRWVKDPSKFCFLLTKRGGGFPFCIWRQHRCVLAACGQCRGGLFPAHAGCQHRRTSDPCAQGCLVNQPTDQKLLGLLKGLLPPSPLACFSYW